MKKLSAITFLFILGFFAKSQTILPPYNDEGGYYGELNNIMRFAARMSTCEEAKQYADQITAYAKDHPIAFAQGNTINNCIEYANNKLAKILENCDGNGEKGSVSSTEKINPEDLLAALDKPLEEKKEIVKNFFIQNGYKLISEGVNGEEYAGYGLDFNDIFIQLYHESEDGINTDGIGTPIISIDCKSSKSQEKLKNLLKNISERLSENKNSFYIL